jgi:hypothetical protein
MPKPRSARRKPVTSDPDRSSAPRPRRGVTSDPDRGVAVNSGTDPQRPGQPPRPGPDKDAPGTAAEDSVPADRFDATHEPATSGRGEDVERGPRGTTDDPAE